MYKWFGIEPRTCVTCDLLREMLAKSEQERSELLHRLLDKANPEPPPVVVQEEMKPVGQTFVPWRVRQQMLEAEDRKTAQLMKQRNEEIAKLENELDIPPAVPGRG